MNVLHYVTAALAILIPFAAYLKRSLKLSASILALVMVAVAMTVGEGYALFLLLAFVLISAIDRFCKKRSEYVNSNYTQKTGARDAVQVLANGGIAMLSVLVWHAAGNRTFLFCFVASLIESFGDSAASAVGITFGRQTYSICGFRKMKAGLSGGVSVEGTLACAISCIAMALIACVLGMGISIREALLTALSAFLGCIADSVLGSVVQRKNKCACCGVITGKKAHCNRKTEYASGVKWVNNDVVNFACNCIRAITIFLLVGIGR